MIASITTATSAALAVTAGAANAQGAATNSAPASGTVYTGDGHLHALKIQKVLLAGFKVVDIERADDLFPLDCIVVCS
jgi:hypothetical protein